MGPQLLLTQDKASRVPVPEKSGGGSAGFSWVSCCGGPGPREPVPWGLSLADGCHCGGDPYCGGEPFHRGSMEDVWF